MRIVSAGLIVGVLAFGTGCGREGSLGCHDLSKRTLSQPADPGLTGTASTAAASASGSPANAYQHFVKLPESTVLIGLVRSRGVLVAEDDPLQPDFARDFPELRPEFAMGLVHGSGEVVIVRWAIDVRQRLRGPRINTVPRTVYLTRPIGDFDAFEHRTRGTFPAEFADLREGQYFEFTVVPDDFRTRGENGSRSDLFTVTGWRAADPGIAGC